MRYLMIVSSMALGLAMPALAQDAPPAADSAKQQGTVQPPTNRIDKLVPNMKGPDIESDQGATTDDSSSGAASGEQGKGPQSPTKSVGAAVPNMKSPNAASDLPSGQPSQSK
jgi:hypothetical protein